MASQYHSKVRPLKTWESHFPNVWVIELTIISTYFGKGKVFSKNPKLTNLAEI